MDRARLAAQATPRRRPAALELTAQPPGIPAGPALLLDTYSLVYRAHHVRPARRSASGAPIAALCGFLDQLRALVATERPGGVAFALDGPAPSFRRQLDDRYKAQRRRTPADLARQLRRLAELLERLGGRGVRVPEFEADDVLATMARTLRERQTRALVVSGDRDLIQLAHGSIEVLRVGRYHRDRTRYDEALVEARLGVPASRLPLVHALLGDKADNVPGVPTLGPRTAARLARQWDSVPDLLGDLRAVQPPRLRRLLGEHAERIRANAATLALRDRVPLPSGWLMPIDGTAIDAATTALEA